MNTDNYDSKKATALERATRQMRADRAARKKAKQDKMSTIKARKRGSTQRKRKAPGSPPRDAGTQRFTARQKKLLKKWEAKDPSATSIISRIHAVKKSFSSPLQRTTTDLKDNPPATPTTLQKFASTPCTTARSRSFTRYPKAIE